jgi:NADH:ubiquinone oxidoreductase subunit 2 (subunit N)
MLWCSVPELSLCIGLIMIILYGLFSLSIPGSPSSGNSIALNAGTSLDRSASLHLVSLSLNDVYFFSRLWPFMLLLGYMVDFNPMDTNSGFFANLTSGLAFPGNNGIDLLLILLTVVIMQSFKSFESVLLLLLAFVGQLFMLHSCDLVSFYICLEAQNFCFLVLCALQPRAFKANMARGSRPLAGVEASIKYLLLSAFSSGVLLFWFSVLYLRTGITTLSWGPLTSNAFDLTQTDSLMDVLPQMLILIALMFKLGGAPLHIWMVDIYGGVKRQLIMVLSTAPKLSLFGFWVSTWHSVWTDMTVLLFVVLSMVIGCIGAYNQPTLRSMFAYSTINEIGLMLMAIETAGFHSLFQHLTIYIITMLLLWNQADKRLFSIIAVSLAGLPPLAGFFGKTWIFNSVANGALAGPYLGVLIVSLFCTCLSLVYYLRVFRLFTMTESAFTKNGIYPAGTESSVGSSYLMSIQSRTYGSNSIDLHVKLTSFCVVFLVFAPLFYLKPFVL